MKEEWKPVIGYEGLYEVSNMGRVKSLKRAVWYNNGYYKTVPEKILKAWKNKDGYLQVGLHKDGKSKLYYVHRLAAEVFLDNPQNLPVINHRDENKSNNVVSNLEWCSVFYNNTYKDRAKKAGKKTSEKLINNTKLSKAVFGINKVSGLILEFPSAREAGRVLGINQSHITKCCKGKYKSIGGFYWYYAE